MRNSGVIALDYVQSAKNLADPFTQGLSRNEIDEASREMGLRPTWELCHSGNWFYLIGDPVKLDNKTNYWLTEKESTIVQTHSVEDALSPFSAWQVVEYLNVIQVASWKQRCPT